MNLSEITEKLKKDYLVIVKDFENAVDIGKISLQIPKLQAPFQFHYYDLLNEYSKLQDELEEHMYTKFWNAKIGNHELSNISLTDTNLRKAITETKEYREISKRQNQIKNDMKIIEEMMTTIKNFGFNINNTIKFREFMEGK